MAEIIVILMAIIVIAVYLKCFLLLVGYLCCFIYTSYMSRVMSRLDFHDKVAIKEWYSSNQSKETNYQIKATLFLRFKCYCSRIIEGWLGYTIIITGKIPVNTIRMLMYKHIYHMKLGSNVLIRGDVKMRSPWNIEIGENTIIGQESYLDGSCGLIIGKNTDISFGVCIWTVQHNPQCPQYSMIDGGIPVSIGDRVWISSRAIILPGVGIGEGAVVAAGSVVTRDVKPFTICAGIPAQKINERNRDLGYEFDNSRHLSFY